MSKMQHTLARERGFVYLAVVLDWFSRRVLPWCVSITMEAAFCVETLEDARVRRGHPASRTVRGCSAGALRRQIRRGDEAARWRGRQGPTENDLMTSASAGWNSAGIPCAGRIIFSSRGWTVS